MNQHLQNILNTIKEDKNLSEEEKNAIIKSLKDADKEIEIINFKLDRTEKVKRTTAILLEETIEELEQKRKAVEAQNKELEIEASLERVRAVAMSMIKADDLLNVCETLFNELKLLGFTEIRNALIGIFNDDKKYLSDYDYSDFAGGTINKIPYHKNALVDRSLQQMKSATDAFTEFIVEGKELEEWKAFRKQNGEYDDTRIKDIDTLYYYFYSISLGYIGLSTFKKISEEQLTILKRFRNVFELAYKRYVDITNAAAQAQEARIEASLERMRAVAMSMRKSEDVIAVCESMYKELTLLGFTNIRNAQIAINNDAKKAYIGFEYSDYSRMVMKDIPYDTYSMMKEVSEEMKKSNNALFLKEIAGKQFEEWRAWRKSFIDIDDPRVETATSMCFYLFSIGTGIIGITSFNPITDEQVETLKRFRNVFELSYQRYTDVAKAEAQAREAQIELALERVRARTMAMQKSDELRETSLELFQQLKELGEPAEQLTIGVIKEEENVVEVSATLNGIKLLQTYQHDINEPFIMNKMFKAWKAKEKTLVIEQQWEELKAYNQYRNKLVQEDMFPVDLKPGDKRLLYVAFYSKGTMGLSSNEPRPKETLELLERFAKVFDQTYTRFLDLQKAEAQAREAKIEAALEKVRSRSLAVHKSDEFKEVISVVFEKMQELEIPVESASINIYVEGSKDVDVYACGHSENGLDIRKATLRYFDHPIANDLYNAHINELDFFVGTYGIKEKNSYYQYQFEHGDLKELPAEIKERILQTERYSLSMAPSKNSIIITNNFDGKQLSEIEISILKRFAKVFEQAYIRFRDLQKAEAQAREAQIELALERVRARTMAMQKSDELSETAYILYQQFKELGQDPEQLSIGIVNESNRTVELWLTMHGKLMDQMIPVSIDEPFVISKAYAAYKQQKKSSVIDLSGKELKDYNDYRNNLRSGLKVNNDRTEERRVINLAFFSKGQLSLSSPEPISVEGTQLLERFAKVFDQTYTRFLDLQKAEAQAKEARIEAALEKVRSRSLAMHKSDELSAIAKAMFEQLRSLGLELEDGLIIMLFREGSHDQLQWPVSEGIDTDMMFLVPYFDHPVMNEVYKAREMGIKFIERHFEKAFKDDFLKKIFSITDYKIVPVEIQNKNFSGLCYHYSFAMEKYTGILLHSYNRDKYPEEHNDILRRFARVFEQAYVRFLDLQKAEAQAREAKIEAALERTRTQSMIMQHSKELDDTLRVFHEQVLLLGIKSAFSFLWLPDEKGDRHIFWAAWEESLPAGQAGKNGSTVFKSKAINYPLDRNEPATAQCLIDWKSNEPVVSYQVPPSGVENYFAAWQELIDGVEQLKPEHFSGGLYYVEAFMKYGCFGVIVTTDLIEDEKKILSRFAIEFERTYTRFLDLQKAEAQAREAQIEAALERLRSRTMAMRRSDELLDTSQLFFQQIKELGETVVQASIAIVNEETGFVELSSSINDSHLPFTLNVPIDDPYVMAKGVVAWKEKQKSLTLEFKGQELKDYNERRNSFLEKKVNFPEDQWIVNLSFFSKGWFSFSSNKHESGEIISVLTRFAAVFEQTYTRFLDLQKAEEQAREAKIEASLERVRSKAMSMQKSEDLAAAITIVFEELHKLDLGMLRCGIGILNKEKRTADVWTTTIADNNTVVQVAGDEAMDIHPLLSGAFEAWLNQIDHNYTLKGEDLNNYYKAVAGENFKLPDSQSLVTGTKEMIQYYYNAVWPSGGLFAFRETPFPEEAKIILRRFADVFTLTYTRFSDLKHAEAQAKEAKIEVALERVRSRTLAMQKSDELAETAAVLFRQLINLGIAPNRLYIGIVKDDSRHIEFWVTDEDGSKVSTQFTGDANRNTSMKKMYDAWKGQKKSLTIDMQGKELQDYFHYLADELNVPFKQGLEQKRRIQTVAVFGKGFIGIASPDDQPEETTLLLERFAAVFNLTYTRFNDLKVAEAHAIQAKEDLIKLQTEKKRAEDALTELRSTQTQLIQSEKMASLGELTAGIAHEIQNPLNFVNNFSEVSNELIDEMNAEIEKGDMKEAKAIASDIKQNLEKINHHGKRADAIVKGMLQHSRSSTSTKEPTDINKLADEYLRLAYHGLRAKDKSFNATLKTSYDETIGSISIIPQDVGRVILNLITNAFYATIEKKKQQLKGYEPTVTVSTKKINGKAEIRVIDNGNGIPPKVLGKIFQPFFTTKPTGQGTGLGLSLAYDIVKAHGGELKVETNEGLGSVFTIELPRI